MSDSKDRKEGEKGGNTPKKAKSSFYDHFKRRLGDPKSAKLKGLLKR